MQRSYTYIMYVLAASCCLVSLAAQAQDAKGKKNAKASSSSDKEQLAGLLATSQGVEYAHRAFIPMDEQTRDNVQTMQKRMLAEDVSLQRGVLFLSNKLLVAEQSLIRYAVWFEKARAFRLLNETIRLMYGPAAQSPIQTPIVGDNGGLTPEFKQIYNDGTAMAEVSKQLSQEEYSELMFCLNYLGINISEIELLAYYLSPRAEVVSMVKNINLTDTRLKMWVLANDIRFTLYTSQPGIDPIAFNQ